MRDNNDELQIQRCVDQELSPAETRALLQSLDGLNNGWKQLACGLLEDRNFRTAINAAADLRRFGIPVTAARDADTATGSGASTETFQSRASRTMPAEETRPSTASQEPPVPSRGRSAKDVARRWWSHPVTSLTLCAAIAFVSGLLIPDMLTGTSGGGRSSEVQGRVASSPPRRGQGNSYFVEMQPGRRRVEVPVVSEMNELLQLDPNHPLFSEPASAKPKLSWRLIPLEGNLTMLIPVQEDPGFDIQ